MAIEKRKEAADARAEDDAEQKEEIREEEGKISSRSHAISVFDACIYFIDPPDSVANSSCEAKSWPA